MKDAHSMNRKQAATSHVFDEASGVHQIELVRKTFRPTSMQALGLELSRVARRSTGRIGPRSRSARITLLGPNGDARQGAPAIMMSRGSG